jgi:hypothetical protein
VIIAVWLVGRAKPYVVAVAMQYIRHIPLGAKAKHYGSAGLPDIIYITNSTSHFPFTKPRSCPELFLSHLF